MSETLFYATITSNNQANSTPEVSEKPIQVLKIIPPFRKQNVESPAKLNEAYATCAQSILGCLPGPIQKKTTISRTFTVTKDGKKLHSLTIVSPPEAETYFNSFKSEGINLLGKTTFPMGFIPQSQRVQNFYPRKVKVKIQNLPFICGEVELVKLLNLPNGIHHNPVAQRDTFELSPGNLVYTGKAILEVIVPNPDLEEELRKWSYEQAISEGKDWNGVNITFHAPSMHVCDTCTELGKQSKGHHKDWCMHTKYQPNRPNRDAEDKTSKQKTPATSNNNELQPQAEVNTEITSTESDLENYHPTLAIDEQPVQVVQKSCEVLAEETLQQFRPPSKPEFNIGFQQYAKNNRNPLSAHDLNTPSPIKRGSSPYNFVTLQRRSRPRNSRERYQEKRAQKYQERRAQEQQQQRFRDRDNPTNQ